MECVLAFIDELKDWPRERVEALIAGATLSDVERAVARQERSVDDLAALLSPGAVARLEPIAHEAQRLTRWHFGRTIGLYVPLYLSNVCGAECAYCNYAARSGGRQKRVTLDESQIRQECAALAARGFQQILLLTGEAPHVVPVKYLADAVAIAREYFSSVSVEIYVLERDGYEQLVKRGLEGVALYMETYDRATYERVHRAGQKRNYEYRLKGIERAGLAGARRLSLGVLLGLFDWRMDAFWLALHARYLQKACWQSAVSISFPRLRNTPAGFQAPAPVGDRDLVQMMLALRLFLPEAGFNLSTREGAGFRDHLLPLGVTMMSAGSSTHPGGYSLEDGDTLEQFAVEDCRSVAEVAESIRRAGYDPVWKDFDRAFVEDTAAPSAKGTI